MVDNKRQEKLNKLLIDLNSEEPKRITKAVKTLERHGDASVIKPLALRLLKDIPEKNKSEILELFCSLKDTSTCVEIMDILGDEKFNSIRQRILSTIWNTKIDYSDYLDDFVEIATKGNLLEALDCLTIIENLEGPFIEESVLESQLHLKNYLESDRNSDRTKDDRRTYIISEIALKIKEIDARLMD